MVVRRLSVGSGRGFPGSPGLAVAGAASAGVERL